MCHEVRKLENICPLGPMLSNAHSHLSLTAASWSGCSCGASLERRTLSRRKVTELAHITQLESKDLKSSLSESRVRYFIASLVFAPTLASWLISSFSFLSESLPKSLSLFSLPHRLPPTTHVYLSIAFSMFFKGPWFRKVSLPDRFASPRFKGQAGVWYPGHRPLPEVTAATDHRLHLSWGCPCMWSLGFETAIINFRGSVKKQLPRRFCWLVCINMCYQCK